MSTPVAPEGEKILVVDDDARLRRLLERFLAEQGYRVRTVESAEQMDRLLAREVFNLVVLDLMMPGEDGLSACGRLRESGNRIPIIMIDPHILAGLPPKLQLFFYLHECGHHALGHWDIRPASAESDADCWAIKRARDWGELLRTEVEQFEPFLARSNGSPFGHLAGPARERHLLQCYDER